MHACGACMHVCVCEREREEREKGCVWTFMLVRVCICVCVHEVSVGIIIETVFHCTRKAVLKLLYEEF